MILRVALGFLFPFSVLLVPFLYGFGLRGGSFDVFGYLMNAGFLLYCLYLQRVASGIQDARTRTARSNAGAVLAVANAVFAFYLLYWRFFIEASSQVPSVLWYRLLHPFTAFQIHDKPVIGSIVLYLFIICHTVGAVYNMRGLIPARRPRTPAQPAENAVIPRATPRRRVVSTRQVRESELQTATEGNRPRRGVVRTGRVSAPTRCGRCRSQNHSFVEDNVQGVSYWRCTNPVCGHLYRH